MRAYFNLFIVVALLSMQAASAQTPMADKFREDGKIYVVVAVISVIFTGISIFLFLTDRRLQKLEKQKQSS